MAAKTEKASDKSEDVKTADVQDAPADSAKSAPEADTAEEAAVAQEDAGGQIVSNLHGEVSIVGTGNARESVSPLEDVPDDLSKLDLDDIRVRAGLKAYRNQIDVAGSDPNMVKKIDAVLRGY
jgi:hypothetical protein